ncbi:MAG: hypothetical protein JWL61_1085 [Gemmatimonadetes bacterium]|nr:hypothetical protein [Gemmatimonadota bacterium]
MLRDKCTLVKADGRTFPTLIASVQPPTIIFLDEGAIPVEEGDILERALPNGLLDRFEILERGYFAARGSTPAHYQSKVRRLTNIAPSTPQPAVYTLNLHGSNARAYVNSHDASLNVTGATSDELFAAIRRAVEDGIIEPAIKANLVEQLAALESARGTPSFTQRYVQFIGTIADHLTLFGPFLPRLAQMLIST